MVKKILILTAALGMLLLMGTTALARGEETRFELSIKLGLFAPSDSDVRDTFRGISSLGIECCYLFPEKPYGISGALEYSFDSKTISPAMDAIWKVTPVTVSFLYFPEPERKSYLGIGWGAYTAEILTRTWGINRTLSYPASGPHILVGHDFNNRLFIESKISSVIIQHRDWKKNIGGVSLWLGYRMLEGS